MAQTFAYQLEICGQTFKLDPSGSLFWEEQSTLLVADLHLGRETVLQRSGRPMPQGSTGRTLQRLRQQVDFHSPQTLLILGDLVHARSALTLALMSQIEATLASRANFQVVLVEGNHDRGSRNMLAHLPIQVVRPPFSMPPFWMLHDLETDFANTIRDPRDNRFSFSGHLHPAFRFPQSNDVVKCFFRHAEGMILPAFGELTGAKKVTPQKGESAFVITGESVFEIS